MFILFIFHVHELFWRWEKKKQPKFTAKCKYILLIKDWRAECWSLSFMFSGTLPFGYYSLKIFQCLFLWVFLRPSREYLVHTWRRYHCQEWKLFDQGEIFIVSHLLWHGTGTLGFCGFIRMTVPIYSHHFRQARGTENLFWPGLLDRGSFEVHLWYIIANKYVLHDAINGYFAILFYLSGRSQWIGEIFDHLKSGRGWRPKTNTAKPHNQRFD